MRSEANASTSAFMLIKNNEFWQHRSNLIFIVILSLSSLFRSLDLLFCFRPIPANFFSEWKHKQKQKKGLGASIPGTSSEVCYKFIKL
jgi:hypothetical protein